MTTTLVRSPYLQIDEARGVFRVARRALIDPEIFEREREIIFNTCWLYLGHESEVAKPGTFLTRYAGGREIIFNRDLGGGVNAFLNSCPHRGARLCTEYSGVAPSFTCFYHGWSFAADGTLRGLPDREAAFAPGFNDDGAVNLVRVPRLENYRGLYFVCFDPEAVALSDYLGATKPYIDDALDQGPQGMEIVPAPQEYAIRANWKLLSENGIDGNHAKTLHATYFEYLISATPGLGEQLRAAAEREKAAPGMAGLTHDLGNGHVVLEYKVPWGRVAGKWSPIMGEDVKAQMEAAFQALTERVGATRAAKIALKARNLLIFPNLHIIDATGLTLRVAHPDTVDSMYVSSYAMAACGEDERLRRIRLQNFLEFLGPGGFATPDDIEAMEQCQRSARRNADVAPWNDYSKGSLTAQETPMEYEGNIRVFWREWARRMGAAAAAPSR